MSRDPLEGIRPDDSDRPSFPTGTPVAPRPGVSPVSAKRSGGAKLVIFIAVGMCVTLGAVAAVFFQSNTSQGPTPGPAATASPAATPTTDAVTSNDTDPDPGIRQLPRHSPDGAPDTPPANEMTTTAPKPKP